MTTAGSMESSVASSTKGLDSGVEYESMHAIRAEMACGFSKPGPRKKVRILIRALIAVLMRPELQTVGFVPQRRSTDDCYALDGDYLTLRRAEALGA